RRDAGIRRRLAGEGVPWCDVTTALWRHLPPTVDRTERGGLAYNMGPKALPELLGPRDRGWEGFRVGGKGWGGGGRAPGPGAGAGRGERHGRRAVLRSGGGRAIPQERGVRPRRRSRAVRTFLNGVCPYFTMFPLAFPFAVLRRHAAPGDLVLDPFCGRGTTGY